MLELEPLIICFGISEGLSYGISSLPSSAGEATEADGENLHVGRMPYATSLWELWKQWSGIQQSIPESPLSSCGMRLWWDQHYQGTQQLLQNLFHPDDGGCPAAPHSAALLHSHRTAVLELPTGGTAFHLCGRTVSYSPDQLFSKGGKNLAAELWNCLQLGT